MLCGVKLHLHLEDVSRRRLIEYKSDDSVNFAQVPADSKYRRKENYTNEDVSVIHSSIKNRLFYPIKTH